MKKNAKEKKKQHECHKIYCETNKNKVIQHNNVKTYYVCNSVIVICNLKRHQGTEMCKNKSNSHI